MSNPAFCVPLMKTLRVVITQDNVEQPGRAHLLCYTDDFLIIACKAVADSNYLGTRNDGFGTDWAGGGHTQVRSLGTW